MLFRPDRTRRLAYMAGRLDDDEPSDATMLGVADLCERVFSSRESLHIKTLINAAAWTDAAMALLAVELPEWKLRRITYDEGEWSCTISQKRELPEWLDSTIETRHQNLAMAILKATVEGLDTPGLDQRCQQRPSREPLEAESLVCCDNFS